MYKYERTEDNYIEIKDRKDNIMSTFTGLDDENAEKLTRLMRMAYNEGRNDFQNRGLPTSTSISDVINEVNEVIVTYSMPFKSYIDNESSRESVKQAIQYLWRHYDPEDNGLQVDEVVVNGKMLHPKLCKELTEEAANDNPYHGGSI